ncbi:hypothetical protein I7I50_11809 [Histoplasma capsulatum G186AR]|uniref:Uncharacterized protein n=1 Tax=Ajellomyces capsulatus TaxID=5037 RepID=A0A8H7Z5S8_AJECA|nr:hypothetical protein I7I52_03047 [Histoplasma capsulatum]QSS70243.1 hypothetical protein I7I50_11809 [Histoplasma capsulatum G186AR]
MSNLTVGFFLSNSIPVRPIITGRCRNPALHPAYPQVGEFGFVLIFVFLLSFCGGEEELLWLFSLRLFQESHRICACTLTTYE